MDLKTFISTRLREDFAPVCDAFRALTPMQEQVTVYTDGAAWCAHDLLAHQLTTERAIQGLIADVLAGGAGMPEGFDMRAFNEREAAALAGRTLADLLAEWETARTATLALVATMTEADFARRGRHPWFGEASLEDTLKLIYRHNKVHLRDLQRTLKGAGS